jgi:hypothetical protein
LATTLAALSRPDEIDESFSEAHVQAAVRHVLNEISADSFAKKIGGQIDQARSTFPLPYISVGSHREFHEICTSFYRHLLAHTEILPVSANDDLVAAEAFRLLNEASIEYGGVRAAEAEALRPTHGGMRLFLDRMTDQLKKELFYKHADRVLKEAIDPLSYRRQVEFMRAFVAHLGDQLPEDVRTRPVEDFIERREELVKHVVHLLDRLADAFRGI